MAATPSNALNISAAGIPTFATTGYSASSTTTLNATQIGGASNTLTSLALGTAGWVLTSAGASSPPAYAAIPFTQRPWTDESSTFTPVVGNGYFVTGNATAVLPASPAQGNTISFSIDAASIALTITANTGQTIRVGSAVSASAGTAVNNARGDVLTLVYRLSDTSWIASEVIGTWTVT